jgi:hypothetical protein
MMFSPSAITAYARIRVPIRMKSPPSSCTSGRQSAQTIAAITTALVTRVSSGNSRRAARKAPRISAISRFIESSAVAKITMIGTAIATRISVRRSV